MEEADQDVIDVARMGVDAFVRVSGKGSFKNSPNLKSFCLAAAEDGAERIVIDMGECAGMDSTFMGVISGLARRLNVPGKKAIVMVNLDPENHELLHTLGVTFLIETYDPASSIDIIRAAAQECGDMDRLADCDGRDRACHIAPHLCPDR